MEYNSSRNQLIIPEYGRNVQKLIEYATELEDREERNRLARAIISIMAILNPQLKDITDYKQKLWDHLFIISDFKLDVDSPFPIPNAQSFHAKPQRVAYPNNKIKYKHYGKTMELVIEEITEMETGPAKNYMIASLANFMKQSYVNWNRDSVTDETIFEQLKELSRGKIEIPENLKLQQPVEMNILKSSSAGKKPSNLRSKNNLKQRSNGNNRGRKN
jgi:hypothetical protein